ncbi:MAG: TetR family transcriptional regulator [Rhizobiales bacterium]|nr:TetR family transcriptional regulator [Hyphomicrobiales bacterium]NRB13621.1 TetR family transcriptional regulator [Hyphomicrobiales bacterium]
MSQNINSVAIKLFHQFGEDFTLDQLSKQANTSRATLYRRIGSKHNLLKKLAADGFISLDYQASAKAKILAATRIVVAKHGFINCTMEQIANQAGLGTATLYRHYAEKHKLLQAFTTALKSDVSMAEFKLAGNLSVEDGLYLLIKTMLKFIDDNVDIVKILFFGNPEERKYISNIRDASSSTFKSISQHIHNLKAQKLIQVEIKTEDLVASLMGQLMHFALTAPLNLGRKLNIDRDAKLITKIFCSALEITKRG